VVTVLPLAIDLRDKDVLVVGAGRIGAGKAQLLVDAGASVTVIARKVLVPLPDGVRRLERREFRSGDLRGYALVVSATGDGPTNDRIVAEARDQRIWVNVVDDPARSDFYFTAVHRAGDVVVSVSTSGASPALAQEIRAMVRDSLPGNLDEVARHLRAERAAMHEAGHSTEGVDWRLRIRQLLASEESIAR
jgi:siroheme synthase-like protein